MSLAPILTTPLIEKDDVNLKLGHVKIQMLNQSDDISIK